MTTKTRAPRQTKRVRLQKRMDAALLALAQVDLIKRSADGAEGVGYAFKHALVQDTAQSTLLHGEYKRLNLLVAEAYENVYADRCIDEFAAVLAQHYGAAGDAAKTILYAARAGDQAARLYANAEAIAFYTTALDAAKSGTATTAQLIHLYTKRGRALEVMGSMEALATYEEMSEFAHARDDRAIELQALLLRGKIHSAPTHAFDRAKALELAQQADTLAVALGDRLAQVHALWNQQLLYLYNQELAAAIEYGEQALALARQVEARELLGYILGDLGRAYLQAGQMRDLQLLAEEARIIWRELDNKPMLADNLMQTATLMLLRGEYDAAFALTEEGIQTSDAIGSRISLLSNRGTQLYIELDRGHFARAMELAQANLELEAEISDGFDPPLSSATAAWVYAVCGALDAAAQMAQQAHARLAGNTPEFFRDWGWTLLAQYYLVIGNLPQAIAALSKSHTHANTVRLDPASIYGIPALGECALAQGEYTQAEQQMAQRVNLLRQWNFRQSLPQLLFIQAQARHALNEPLAALEILHQARAEAEKMNLRRLLWQIYALLGEMENGQGHAEEANAYRERARDILNYIVKHIPSEFRSAFLELPQVREVMA